MPLQNFVDNSLPTIKAAWLNAIDSFYFTLFNSATTPAAARTAIGALGAEVPDDVFRVIGSADATKKARFEVDGFTTGTTNTITCPDRSLTLNELPPVQGTIIVNVSLNNIAAFFNGPTAANPTVGTWLVIGHVTVLDAAGPASFVARISDGTTVISSGYGSTHAANFSTSISLEGVITNPAGNLRIQVKDESSTSGFIVAGNSGTFRDSQITCVRIG